MYFIHSRLDNRLLFGLLLFASMISEIHGQKIIQKTFPVNGDIQLSEEISIPKINPGYTLWLPDHTQATGVIVFTRPRRDSTSDLFIEYSLSKGLAVLYACTDNLLEFFFEAEKMLQIESYIYETMVEYGIPMENLFLCGMSLEGTRALKLANFAYSTEAKHHLRPKGIAICDAPLDMIRFHRSCERAEALNFQAAAANEGKWVSAYLEKNLEGPPSEKRQAYIDYSPYSYSRTNQDNLKFLQNTPIRAYTEPDVQWWMETRRKSYYDMNSIDLAAIINELQIQGNNLAELILTQDKGFKADGTRHPHSWSIVDEKELINWFLGLIQD